MIYTFYDQKNKIIKEVKSDAVIDGRNTASPSEGLDAIHVTNFIDSIRENKMPNADVEQGIRALYGCSWVTSHSVWDIR